MLKQTRFPVAKLGVVDNWIWTPSLLEHLRHIYVRLLYVQKLPVSSLIFHLQLQTNNNDNIPFDYVYNDATIRCVIYQRTQVNFARGVTQYMWMRECLLFPRRPVRCAFRHAVRLRDEREHSTVAIILERSNRKIYTEGRRQEIEKEGYSIYMLWHRVCNIWTWVSSGASLERDLVDKRFRFRFLERLAVCVFLSTHSLSAWFVHMFVWQRRKS